MLVYVNTPIFQTVIDDPTVAFDDTHRRALTPTHLQPRQPYGTFDLPLDSPST